ncbi:hypothetical protein J2T02_004575 [Chitinophaga terrae (ex Kim and Jung 2007)]|uniref:hypothetical protein n=1 Tax=Chitinophaga terrae (ex Kim and Jung 2007) TaxID=408074 RepID=UPI00278B2608|nr:hypothetical protein [Chitinophaga terrae (ex Kim and Jung 2007)]MDQ0109432.1 hypothetical protein [Chitinophaga terrae (ex Kim and Jung 2007)]
MRKVILFFLIVVSFLFAWYGESRRFFCLEDGKCITVWKTYNNVCYVIPGKYYGIWAPSNNFIRTSNLNELTIFFTDELPNTWIVQSKEELKVYNKAGFVFLDYDEDSAKLRDILYKPDAKMFYKDLRFGASLINIDIKENYACNKDGKVI